MTALNERSEGTFEELIEQIKKLNDEREIQTITVTFLQQKKPLIKLVVNEPGEQK